MAERPEQLLINASRVGTVGGLRSFSDGLVQCFEGCRNIEVVVPATVSLTTTLPRLDVPRYLSSPATASRWRPIFWLLYSIARFSTRRARILCTTHHVVPFHRRQIVVLHDLRPLFYPDTFIQQLNFRYMLPRALRRCDAILTVSAASRDQIAAIYGIDPNRIYIIPQQVKLPVDVTRPVPAERPPYLLAVGSTWPHKNVAELLQMHHHWAGRYRLRILGEAGAYMESLSQLVESLGLQHTVDLLSGVDAARMESLFAGCSALVYPSLLEGFGLPPFEAMAFGKPVILSDLPVFRELHGDLPVYVKLGDERSWASAFDQLEGFPEQRLLSGMEHARSYNAERHCSHLLASLRRIWGEPFLRGLGFDEASTFLNAPH